MAGTPTTRQLKAEVDALKEEVAKMKATISGLELAIAAFKRVTVPQAPWTEPWKPEKVEPYRAPWQPYNPPRWISGGGSISVKPKPGEYTVNDATHPQNDEPPRNFLSALAAANRG